MSNQYPPSGPDPADDPNQTPGEQPSQAPPPYGQQPPPYGQQPPPYAQQGEYGQQYGAPPPGYDPGGIGPTKTSPLAIVSLVWHTWKHRSVQCFFGV